MTLFKFLEQKNLLDKYLQNILNRIKTNSDGNMYHTIGKINVSSFNSENSFSWKHSKEGSKFWSDIAAEYYNSNQANLRTENDIL